MQEKYYVGTSVWRDYYEGRSDGIKPLGEFAFQFLSYCQRKKCMVLYSGLIMKELGNAYNGHEIEEMMSIISKQGILAKVKEPDKKQYLEAKRLRDKAKVPFGDAMHAILARDNGAILISRDKHFYELIRIVEVKHPEELI